MPRIARCAAAIIVASIAIIAVACGGSGPAPFPPANTSPSAADEQSADQPMQPGDAPSVTVQQEQQPSATEPGADTQQEQQPSAAEPSVDTQQEQQSSAAEPSADTQQEQQSSAAEPGTDTQQEQQSSAAEPSADTQQEQQSSAAEPGADTQQEQQPSTASSAGSSHSEPLTIPELANWCAKLYYEDGGERMASGFTVMWGEFSDYLKRAAELGDLDLPDALIDWQRVSVSAIESLIEIAERYDRDALIAVATPEDILTMLLLSEAMTSADDSLRSRISTADYQLLTDTNCVD